jgi:hypothetical protein
VNPTIANNHAFHPAKTEDVKELHEFIRGITGEVAQVFDEKLPAGREKALALTKLEEAMFWANAAVARNQG